MKLLTAKQKVPNKIPISIKDLIYIKSMTPLKELLVEYVGEKVKPENDEVTIEHVLDVMAEEFPEFVLALAEENFLRGYAQGLSDNRSFNIENDEVD